jgi:putative restriction endonuclease
MAEQSLGLTVTTQEHRRRLELWRQIEEAAASGIERGRLRQLGIYGGAQGVWIDKATTGQLGPEGATVAVLHTGKHYTDDLSDDVLVYHYPVTTRAGKDPFEIEATKVAGRLKLPLFVLLPLTSEGLRPVRLGWVADWDDDAKQFLIVFGRQPEGEPGTVTISESTFVLHDDGRGGVGKRKVRPSQRKFRFDVLKRYGLKCCVCSTTNRELLVAGIGFWMIHPDRSAKEKREERVAR